MSWRFLVICFIVLVIGFSGLEILEQRINKVNENIKNQEIQLYTSQFQSNFNSYVENIKVNFSLLQGFQARLITKEWLSKFYLNYTELYPALEVIYVVDNYSIEYSFFREFKHNISAFNYEQKANIIDDIQKAFKSNSVVISKPLKFFKDGPGYILFFVPIESDNQKKLFLALFNLNSIVDDNIKNLPQLKNADFNVRTVSNQLIYGQDFKDRPGDIILEGFNTPFGNWKLEFITKQDNQFLYLKQLISLLGFSLMAFLVFYMLLVDRKNRSLTEKNLNLMEAEHKIKQQFQREQVLREVIQLIHTHKDTEQLLCIICKFIGQFINADYSEIILNKDKALFQFEYLSNNVKNSLIGQELCKESQLYQHLMESKEIFYNPDISHKGEVIAKEAFEKINLGHLKTVIIFPIKHNDEILAFFLLGNTAVQRNWSEDEIVFFKTLIAQIGIALYQADLAQELNSTSKLMLESFNQEQCLKTITQHIRTSIDIKEISIFVSRELIKLLKVDLIYLAEFDSDRREITGIKGNIKTPQGLMAFEEQEKLRFQLNKFISRVPETIFFEQSEYSDTKIFFEEVIGLPMPEAITEEYFLRSFVITPILFQNKVFGFLLTGQLFEYRNWQTFELDFLKKVAEQIAIGIYQIKLYEELKAFTDKQIIINKIFEVIRSSIDINEILWNACNEIGKFLKVGRCIIIELNLKTFDSEPIKFEYLNNNDYEKLSGNVIDINPDNSYAFNCILNEQRPFILDKVDDNSSIFSVANVDNFIKRYKIKSLLIIPVIYSETVLSAIILAQCEYERNWTDSEIYFLNSIADQIAIGIHQAKLFKELDIANKKILSAYKKEQTIRKILEVVRSSLDLDQIYGNISSEIGKLFSVNRCFFVEYDEKTDSILSPKVEFRSGPETPSLLGKELSPDEMQMALKIIRRNAPFIIDDMRLFNFTGQDLQRTREAMAKTIVLIPIAYQKKPLGIFVVSNTDYPRRWTTDEIEVLKIVADQAGIAISQVKLYESIREMSRLKSEFLASISHELKTPLNSIIVLSELMQDTNNIKSIDEQIELLQIIHSSGEELLKHINNILDMAKMEFAKKEANLTTFNMQDLLNEMITIIKPLADEKQIKLITNVDSNLKDEITTDKELLKFIVNNLLNNAIKFTPEGKVEISSKILSKEDVDQLEIKRNFESNGKYLYIEVSDTGIGIEEKYHKLIFDEFRQIEDVEVRKYSGTGLGLAICQKSVNILGGAILLESQVGQGSRFKVIIPIKK